MTKESKKLASDRYRKSEKGKRTHRIYMRVYRASKGKKRTKAEFSIKVTALGIVWERQIEIPVMPLSIVKWKEATINYAKE